MAQGREVVVEEFPGLAGLAALEKDWRRLLAEVKQPRYFQDFDWFSLYCRHAFADHSTLLFLSAVDADGVSRAIIPLEQRTERIRRLPLPIWGLIGSRQNDVLLTASSADLLCPEPKRHPELLSVVRHHLSRRRPGAALMLLGRVTGDSMASACAEFAMLHGSARYSQGGFYILRTDCEFSVLEGRLPRPFRRKLRSRARQLAELGQLRFEIVKKLDRAFGDAYARFLEVEASGWKGVSGTRSALCFLDQQRSFIEALHDNPSEVVPQVHLLWLDQRCIAADYVWRYRNQLIRLKIGYDEAFRQFGLGHHMLMEAARRACRDPELDYIDRVTASSAARDWGGEELQPLEWIYARLGGVRGLLGSALLRLPDRTMLRSRASKFFGR